MYHLTEPRSTHPGPWLEVPTKRNWKYPSGRADPPTNVLSLMFPSTCHQLYVMLEAGVGASEFNTPTIRGIVEIKETQQLAQTLSAVWGRAALYPVATAVGGEEMVWVLPDWLLGCAKSGCLLPSRSHVWEWGATYTNLHMGTYLSYHLQTYYQPALHTVYISTLSSAYNLSI